LLLAAIFCCNKVFFIAALLFLMKRSFCSDKVSSFK